LRSGPGSFPSRGKGGLSSVDGEETSRDSETSPNYGRMVTQDETEVANMLGKSPFLPLLKDTRGIRVGRLLCRVRVSCGTIKLKMAAGGIEGKQEGCTANLIEGVYPRFLYRRR